MIKNWTIIQCEKCWREITAKMGRTLCIRCTNEKYRESQKARRENPEYREMYNEKYKR